MLSYISRHAVGCAMALFVLAAYIAVAPTDAPTETDALQASADISNNLAAQHAATHHHKATVVASKDQP